MYHLLYSIQSLLYTIVGYNWCKEVGNLIITLLENVLVVEPDTLLEVELGTSLRAAGDIECLHQLVEREDFLLCTWVPAEERQEVDHSLWEVATLTITGRNLTRLRVVPLQWEYRETKAVAITLRELTLTLWLEEQRQVGEARHGVLPSECLIKKNVQWSTRQPLLTTDYVRDFHQVVVYDVGQVIGWQFVCALIENLVVQDVAHYLHVATNHIVDVDFLSWLNLEANGVLLAVGYQLIHLLLRESQGVAHLHTGMCIILEVLNFGTLSLQLLRSIESDVSLAVVQKLLHIFFIDVATLALAVRTMLTTEAHTLIKLDAQPLEGFQDVFLGSRNETMRVSILDTEHEFTTMLAGKQIIIKGSTNTTDMQCTRWTWGKTHSYFSICHVLFYS